MHLGVVVGFVNWSGIVGGAITLKIDIKTVVAVDDRVAKLPTELALWAIVVIVAVMSLTWPPDGLLPGLYPKPFLLWV